MIVHYNGIPSKCDRDHENNMRKMWNSIVFDIPEINTPNQISNDREF